MSAMRGKFMKRLLHTILLTVLVLAAGLAPLPCTATVYAKTKTADNEVHLEQVHTIYWKAVLRRNLTKGKKVLAKKGSKVVVIRRSYKRGGRSRIQYGKQKRKATVPNSWLSFRSDLTTISKGDYNRATKEAYINKKTRVKKKEKYLVWVSLDKQRVNVFKPSGGKWRLKHVFKCSTGKAGTPTKAGWHRVNYKHVWVRGLKWYTEVVGGGMHRWPGRFNKSLYGKHVASNGCIRLTSKNAHKIYKMIPVGCRVLVY